MCVLYVSFDSKVRPRIFGCVAMGSAVFFILRSRLLVYSGLVWGEQSASCFVKLWDWYVCPGKTFM